MPRDKFAAMASRALGGGDETHQGDGNNGGDDSPPSPPPHPARRDKLAALTARNNSPVPPSGASSSSSSTSLSRGNSKLAAMAKSAEDAAHGQTQTLFHDSKQESPEEIARKKEEYLTKLQTRLSKRKIILDRLDKAEDLTCNLLSIAAQTMEALQDVSGKKVQGKGSSEEALMKLSTAYQQTIQEIHPLITGEGQTSTGAVDENSNAPQPTPPTPQNDTQHLVKAYQNHTMETKQSMYAARVEMRLARERSQILRAFVDLEKQQRQSQGLDISQQDGGSTAPAASRKRSREDGNKSS